MGKFQLRSLFGFDLRSIALFRVILGSVFLADIASHSNSLHAGQALLWVAAMGVGTLFLLGCYSIFVTPVFALLVALLDFSYTIPAIYLYGCVLLPVGVFYSMDRALRRNEPCLSHLTLVSFTTWIMLFTVDYPVSYWILIAWMPSAFWDQGVARLKTQERIGLTLYFDGECQVCRKLLAVLKTFLLFPEVRTLPAQSDPKIAVVMERENSWVVVDTHGRMALRFEGILVLLRASPLAFWLVPILKLKPLRVLGDRFYRWFADHRGSVPTLLPTLADRPITYGEGKWAQILALPYLYLSGIWSWNALSRLIPEMQKQLSRGEIFIPF